MGVVGHMFYGSFGTQKSMVTLISKFDVSKGQFQINVSQIGPNFQIQNFHPKICLSYSALCQDFKNVIYFDVRQLEMSKK